VAFAQNVFVNCPFDEPFYPLLRPLLFTIIYLGLKPRIATERLDSGEVRIAKIVELIQESKYAIHDLSRIKATRKGEFFRLNMAFELGIDIGCRLFKGGECSHKKCLILVGEKHQYQAAISDLSNSDVANHQNEPVDVVVEVRNWLNSICSLDADGPSRIWDEFNFFMGDNYDALIKKGFSEQHIERLPVQELMKYMTKWISKKTY
jgi:hypothetical protein